MISAPLSPWRRVTRSDPCPVCGRADWCSIGERAVLCMRVSSDRTSTGEAGGWLHSLDPRTASPASSRSTSHTIAPRKLSLPECESIHRRCVADLSDRMADSLSSRLRVSVRSLRRLGLGWSYERSVYTVPMRDADGSIVGIRTRSPEGEKRCIPGSRLGLVMPVDGDDRYRIVPDWLLVTEGESDAAAAIDLGFAAIGRPGCQTCGDIIIGYIQRIRPERVAVIADRDDPGQRGAHALARSIAGTARIPTRVLSLPGAKDIRDWKRLPDASHQDLVALLEAPATARRDD
jgi:hypothetical protein